MNKYAARRMWSDALMEARRESRAVYWIDVYGFPHHLARR